MRSLGLRAVPASKIEDKRTRKRDGLQVDRAANARSRTSNAREAVLGFGAQLREDRAYGRIARMSGGEGVHTLDQAQLLAPTPSGGGRDSAPHRAGAPGSPFSPLEILEERDVQRLLGHDPLQTRILLLQRLQPLGLIFLQRPRT